MKLPREGFVLEYADEGVGPPIVFLHSMGTRSEIWQPQADALAHRFRVIRLDTRGHGHSDSPPGRYTLKQLGDDVRALLDYLSIARAHIVGLSAGGFIAQAFACAHPSRVSSLVLAGTACRYPPETIGKWEARIKLVEAQGMEPVARAVPDSVFSPAFVLARPDVVERTANMMRDCDPAGYIGVCAALPALDFKAALGALRVPALIIAGEVDKPLPVPLSRELCDAIPGATLCIVAGAGHFISIEQPEIFTGLLIEFLDSLKY